MTGGARPRHLPDTTGPAFTETDSACGGGGPMAPEIVGRARERGAIQGFVGSVERGPAAIAIAGEAGAGKSALWRFGVQEAERAGLCVLTCRTCAAEATAAFTRLDDLLRPHWERIAAALPPPPARLVRVLPTILADSSPNQPLRLGMAGLGALAS